jgi:2-phospho-L-lactate guanylyltransferase
MPTVAIVPLRSLHDGKRRLRGVLSSAERTALVKRLFLRAQQAIVQSEAVDLLCVVSPDPALLTWVAQVGALPLLQPGQGLNAGLEYARQTLLARQAWSSLLVVLPDLPMIEAADVAAVVRMGEAATIVVAPDRHGSGTNALLLQPADSLPFYFGAQSLLRHMAAAQTRELAVRQYEASSMAFDLDTADDLRAFEEAIVARSTTSRCGS